MKTWPALEQAIRSHLGGDHLGNNPIELLQKQWLQPWVEIRLAAEIKILASLSPSQASLYLLQVYGLIVNPNSQP